MEAEHPDMGELIYQESAPVTGRSWKAFVVTLAAMWVVLLLLPASLILSYPRWGSSEAATVLVILAIVGAVALAYVFWVFRPLRLYEKGLTTRRGKFIPYETLRRVHMILLSGGSGCWIWFSKSLGREPKVTLVVKEAEVKANRHIELARRLEDLGLVVSATKQPKAEDDGLVGMTRGAVLLQEPPEMFSAWRRRALIGYELLVLSPFLLATAAFVLTDLWKDGAIGPTTSLGGTFVLALGLLFGIVVAVCIPRDGWCFYEKVLVLHSLANQRYWTRYEDCGYAVLHRSRVFGTGTLRVYLEGGGTAGDIPVGEKKHAYGDVDRLVELLESKGVPVER